MTGGRGFDLWRFDRERKMRGVSLGSSLVWLGSTDSTNDDALAAAKRGDPHGSVFGAETQLRGRGRRGSEWLSAPGEGLWFSVLLRPQLKAEVASGLALCAGLAIRQAVAGRVNDSVLVKWPNDVLVGNLKVAGVLVESQMGGQELESAVVGIGLNVLQTEFPPELRGVATSLTLLQGQQLTREVLLAEVLAGLEARLARLIIAGLGAIARELRSNDALLGRRLRVDALEGTGAGIDEQGRLLLKLDDGRVEPQLTGHVTLLRSP